MAGTGSGIYETPPSLVRGVPSDSQELSAFFNQLIPSHNASSSASCVTTTKAKIFAPPTPGFICSEDPNRFSQPVNHSSLSDVVADSSPSFDFSDPYAYVPAHVKEVPQSELFSHSFDHSDGISPENNPGVFIGPVQNAEVPELPSNPVPRPRSSSKRSRDAEFHNLSEKRRRSRINEKLKALQKLIPNFNKTDKASMLDQAIEYLKQLQLQVQILMMRNGLSLHPMPLPGGLQPMTLPQTGLNFDEGKGLQDSNCANAETSARPGLSFPKHCSISNPSSMKHITSSDTSSSFQPPIKDAICGSMPQLILDATKIGKPHCPDVS